VGRQRNPYRERLESQESFFRDLVRLKPQILDEARAAVDRLPVPRLPADTRFRAVRDACLGVWRTHVPALVSSDGEPAWWFVHRLRDEAETFENAPTEPPRRPEVIHVTIPPPPQDRHSLGSREWRHRVNTWVSDVRHAFDEAFRRTVGRPPRGKSDGEGRLKDLLGKRAQPPPFEWASAPRERPSRAKRPATAFLARLFVEGRTNVRDRSLAATVRRQCDLLGLSSPLRGGRPGKKENSSVRRLKP
jgi:hypothetical protein